MDILGNPSPHSARQQQQQQQPQPQRLSLDHRETGGVRKKQRLSSYFPSIEDASPARFSPFCGSGMVDTITTARLPLGESSGNVQQHLNAQSFVPNRDIFFGGSSRSSHRHHHTLTLSSSHSTPANNNNNSSNNSGATTPILDLNYGISTRQNSFSARRGNNQHLHLDFASSGSNNHSQSLYGSAATSSGLRTLPSRKVTPMAAGLPVSYNPLYNNAGFRAYRAKQAEKAIDGREEQKWPEWLEQAFCDALLTIPAMGRHKYQMMKRPAATSVSSSSDNSNNNNNNNNINNNSSSSSSSNTNTSNSNDQAGRNMLISEWLWLVYLETLPTGSEMPVRQWEVQVANSKTGERKNKTMHHAMVRDRKMVSSHIQVTKNFFKDHPLQHFIFVTEEKRANGHGEDEERESFKDNTVLRSLRESRLPDKRYNYQYWAYLLGADKRVQVRPKECWILVAASSVNFVSTSSSSSSKVHSSSSFSHGEGYNANNGVTVKSDISFYAYHAKTGETLDERRFPHLEKNLKREGWPRSGANIKGCMLHEYTRNMSQVPSTSIRNLRLDWEDDFPELHEPLANALADGVQDIIHCKASLDVSEAKQFPVGAELNSCIEVSIDQPELVGHDWKVVTRFCRPQELCRDRGVGGPDPFFSVETKAMGHDGNCDGVSLAAGGNCHCVAARQKNELMVPYPAAELATMLSRLATFPAHAFVGFEPSPEELAAEACRKKRGRKSNNSITGTTTSTTTSTTSSPAAKKPIAPPTVARSSKSNNDDNGGADPHARTSGSNSAEPVTQMSLVAQVAMMQELWSQEPASAATTPGQQQPWTRRCLLLWTFETLYSIDDKALAAGHKYPITRQAAGSMSWRFMSALDPSDAMHLHRSLISGDEAAAQIAAVAQSVTPNAVYTPSGTAILGSSPGPGLTSAMVVPSSTPTSTNGASRVGTFHRDQVMSPSPSFQQHMSASMAENYAAASSAWSGGAGILPSNGPAAYAANYPHQTQAPTAAMHGSTSTTYGQRGGTCLFRGLMDDFRHSCNSPGPGLATPPPTAGLVSMAAHGGSAGTPPPQLVAQHISSGSSLAPSLGFMSTASTVDSCVESVVDPFLTSASFGAYHHDGVGPEPWEAMDSGYNAHGLPTGGWTVTTDGNVGGGAASAAASSFNGHACWDSPTPHQAMSQQQQWNTPAVSTPGSAVLDLGGGGGEYSHAEVTVPPHEMQWRQQQHSQQQQHHYHHNVLSSQPSPCHSPSPHEMQQHAAVVQSQEGGSGMCDLGTNLTAPNQQQEQQLLVTDNSGQITRKRQREDEGVEGDDYGRGVDVTDAPICNHEEAWVLIDA